MTSRLNPYLSFAGEARAAMAFYRTVFGGDLTVSTFGEYGMEGPVADQLMHAQLETPAGYTLMAADTPPEMEHRTGSQITVSLSGDNADQLRGYWQALSDGATVDTELARQMWGDEFGQLTDRFGIGWLVNIAGSAT